MAEQENDERQGKTLAFYATQRPEPEQTYAGIPTPAGVIYIRTVEVDGLAEATDLERENEILLNTIETEDLAD